jgi:glycosidase
MKKLVRNLLFSFFLFLLGNNLFAQNNTYWWNDAVFYEIFVRSFYDSNGDGIGDIKGIIEKLDYLNDGNPHTTTDLGVKGIWLMPISPSPSYHGYDVTDYKNVEPAYGTLEDFKLLMEEAHKRGIRVIIDFVMNHSSAQHPWFIESASSVSSPYRNWYRWSPTALQNSGPWGQKVWHEKNSIFYYGVFSSNMPDLNYNSPAVKEAMFDAATFWLEEMNVDGFRLDAIKYIYEDGNTLEDLQATFDFFHDFRLHYKNINPNSMSVGEAWTSTNKVIKYVENERLDFCFEFDLASAMINAVQNGTNTTLINQMQTVYATYPYLQYATFLTNHDINRIYGTLGQNDDRSRLAAGLLLTLPGVPFIYYGEEVGMVGEKPDQNIRRPMQWDASTRGGFSSASPWTDLGTNYTTHNVATQRNKQLSLWNNYQQFIRLRNEHVALRQGDWKLIQSSTNSVFSFARQTNEQKVLVVANLSASDITNYTLSAGAHVIPAGNYTAIELTGNGIQQNVQVSASGFSNYKPLSTLKARTVYVINLTNSTILHSTLTLRVNMNVLIQQGTFNPDINQIELIGDFAQWQNNSSILTETSESGVYEIILSEIPLGKAYNYKLKISGEADEFPNQDMRRFVAQKPAETVYLYYGDKQWEPFRARIAANTVRVRVGETVYLECISTGNPIKYTWTATHGIPASATESLFAVTYNQIGTYTIQLVVENSNEETDASSITITVRDPLESDYERIGIIGTAVNGAWVQDVAMIQDAENASIWRLESQALETGNLKFRANQSWASNWGGTSFPQGKGTQDGLNIPVTAGIYDISFHDGTGDYLFTLVTATDTFTQDFMRIYPVPSADTYIIVHSNQLVVNETSVQITDLSGKMCSQTTINTTDPHFYIDISNLASGTYLVHITHPKGRQIGKFIKK